ncbi:MAG: TlpA family protein disulfide reductase, partial [Proteobacteria bacterium]|nr:TlpA family protein disulfide reductase [Pseudomonadota bacterium]
MSKREYWLLGGIGLLFAAIGIYLGVKKHENPPPAPDVAAILFTHTLPDLDGQQHPLRQWQGKILLINFWATWCPPCVEEMPELSALQT